MSHPHHYLLEEFAIAIRAFEPTISSEIKEEAQQLHDRYLADTTVSREEIKKGMYEIGLKTYADRNAYHELVKEGGAQQAHGSISMTEEQKDRYEVLRKEWEERKQAITRALDQLEVLKGQSETWGAEIAGQIDQFKEGFLVTEPDPQLYDVQQALEYWSGVMKEGR